MVVDWETADTNANDDARLPKLSHGLHLRICICTSFQFSTVVVVYDVYSTLTLGCVGSVYVALVSPR